MNMMNWIFIPIMNHNPHANGIDIYVLAPGIGVWGVADNVPGSAIMITGDAVNTTVLTHEMGHILGLEHTHSGSGCGDFWNCQENPNGSNCRDCGDQICDTPADPCLTGNVNASCQYTGPNTHNPDVFNYMSYTGASCMRHFTLGQMNRMHAMIESASVLQAVVVPNDLCFLPPCQTNWTLTQPPSTRKIEASNQITATCVLQGHQIFTFDANNEIRLQTGFHAKAGTGFHAYLDGCGNFRTAEVRLPVVTQTPIGLEVRPNPFSTRAHLSWTLPDKGLVDLKIFDAFGKLVIHPIRDQYLPSGDHAWTWVPDQETTGIYFAVLKTHQGKISRKLLLTQ